MNIFKRLLKRMPYKVKRIPLIIGCTSHCVNCGKKLKTKITETGEDLAEGVRCGSLVTIDGDLIIASFCNDICLRDMSLKGYQHSPWLESYGLLKFDDRVIYA